MYYLFFVETDAAEEPSRRSARSSRPGYETLTRPLIETDVVNVSEEHQSTRLLLFRNVIEI